MGRIIRKTNCDSCGSSNNKCEYDDGSTWCFTPDCEGNKKAFAKKEENTVVPDRFDPALFVLFINAHKGLILLILSNKNLNNLHACNALLHKCIEAIGHIEFFR